MSGSLSSCLAPVFFTESQPSFVKSETEFKKEYHGKYFNYEDSVHLTILSESILVDPHWFGEEKRDTLFSISETNVLKSHRGKYFLNYLDFDNSWALLLVRVDQDILSFYCLNLSNSDESIKKLGTVTEIRDECGDVVKTVFDPSKKGFKKLTKERNLIVLSLYQKINSVD